MKLNYPILQPHTLSVEEILVASQTDQAKGLSQSEAALRAKEFGPNSYKTQKQKSIWLIFILQFKSPIVYLLMVAALVTFYFENHIEALAIVIVLLVNAIIGFLMEMQARSSMNALKEMDVIESKVIRDGNKLVIPSEEIVPGDLFFFEAGDVIPADGRLVEANQLKCDESSLTGESLPTEKNTSPIPKEAALGDRLNMVFKGTSVMNGKGKAIITGIAEHTELGTITSLVDVAVDKETPLDKKINQLSKKLIWITVGMTCIFAITGLLQGKHWLALLETSIALAVAAFPEGLPIVATVALAYGMLLMAKRNAIVKKLSAVETLGSTNVILTDKTGTLTENKIFVDTLSFSSETAKVILKDNSISFDKNTLEKSEVEFQKIRLVGVLCNNATLLGEGETENLTGDPIEVALLLFANASGQSAIEMKQSYEKIFEVPFNSDTKIMGTLHKGPNGNFVAVKGSPEQMIAKCTRMQVGSEVQELTEEKKKKLLADSELMAASGLRVLGFAYREGAEINTNDFLNSFIHIGLIGFLDPPRTDIKEAIHSCKKAGIKIVMITGDHPLTALAIAKGVGMVEAQEQSVLIGNDLPTMESLSEEWNKKILATSVFARTTPKQKLEIVSVYQKAGNIVAMTGDGVNDAPALKKADIGIAMGIRGTQVAKEAANIVLKDDSFTSIARAVAHGREIFQNIQKFVIYLVSCNLSEIFIVTSLGFIAPASTLLPLQILFLNMVTDVFPALALGLGKGDKTIMEAPPRDAKSPIVSSKNWISIGIYTASITLAVLIAVFYTSHYISKDTKLLNNVAFITLAFSQLFHVFNMSSLNSNFWVNDITKNKFIWFALILCSLIMAFVFLIPTMRQALGLVILENSIWVISLLASLLPLVFIQLYKFISRSRTMEVNV